MEQLHTKRFLGTPFEIQCSSVVNSPGTWDSTKVSIYNDKILIGEYIRNYSNFGSNTFYPFRIENNWYALYSAKYTATRVMKLYDDKIEDWCGEESQSNGFCPVEFYVPRYVEYTDSYKHGEETIEYNYYVTDSETSEKEFLDEVKDNKDIIYCKFAFLCGCVWGDDSSWKIRYIDLSEVNNKILKIEDKFGYWEMPNNLSLKQCVDLSGWEPDHQWIRLTRMENINLNQ